MRLTGGKGVDVIIDGVGGKLTARRLVACFPEERMRWSATLAVARRASTSPISSGGSQGTCFTFRAFAPETLAAAQKTLNRLSPKLRSSQPSPNVSALRCGGRGSPLIEDRPFAAC